MFLKYPFYLCNTFWTSPSILFFSTATPFIILTFSLNILLLRNEFGVDTLRIIDGFADYSWLVRFRLLLFWGVPIIELIILGFCKWPVYELLPTLPITLSFLKDTLDFVRFSLRVTSFYPLLNSKRSNNSYSLSTNDRSWNSRMLNTFSDNLTRN